MNIIIDMNLSPRWEFFLNQAGFNAYHWSSIGSATDSDYQITAYAREHNAIILTHDLDFSAILAATQGNKPSVIQIRSENLKPDTIGNAVVLCLNQMATELERGALITLETEKTRLRLLPLMSN